MPSPQGPLGDPHDSVDRGEHGLLHDKTDTWVLSVDQDRQRRALIDGFIKAVEPRATRQAGQVRIRHTGVADPPHLALSPGRRRAGSILIC